MRKEAEVEVDGQRARVRSSLRVRKQVLEPIARWACARSANNQRSTLIGVVGGAGSGKTWFSTALCEVCCGVAGRADAAVVVGMDAYHFPNSRLLSQTTTLPGLGRVSLKAVKGTPQTIDARSLLHDLRRAKADGRQECVRFPAYDRNIHDPVPDRIVASASTRIFVVEGLHLLRDEAPWAQIGALLDARLFLEVPKAVCRERVVSRKFVAHTLHAARRTPRRCQQAPRREGGRGFRVQRRVRNGADREAAELFYHRVDSPIFDELVRWHKPRADVVVSFCPAHEEPDELVGLCISSPGGLSVLGSGARL